MNSTYSSSGPPKFNSNKHSLLRKLTKIITFKDDTGATPIYVQYKNADISNYLQLKTTSSQFYFPENSVIQSTHFFHLPLSSSPPAETQAHTHLNLQSARLFFFDSDCSAIFTKKDVTIFNSDNTPILNVKWSTTNGFWDVKMASFQTA